MKTTLRWINLTVLVAFISSATSGANTTEEDVKSVDKEAKKLGILPCPSSFGSLFGVTLPDFATGQNVCNTACGGEARCRLNPKQVILTKGRLLYRCSCTTKCGPLSLPFGRSAITCAVDGGNACKCATGLTSRKCILPLEPLFPTLAAPLAMLNPLDVNFCTCCPPA